MVPPPRPGRPVGIALYSDAVIPSARRLVDAVHRCDTRFGSQLWHGGDTEGTGSGELLSPSGLSSNVRNARADAGGRKTGEPNRAIDVEEIDRIVRYFAHGAMRVAEAGFDFVEIHAGHGYLISNFLTPLFNRRTDAYGGSFENRTRFLLRITAAVKAAVGMRIAVGVKYNGDDFLGADGWTLEESRRLARVKNVHSIEVGGNDDVWLLTDADREELPGIDTIVFAGDRRSDRGLVELARATGAATYVIGDAHDVVSENAGTIFANIAHAYDTARQV